MDHFIRFSSSIHMGFEITLDIKILRELFYKKVTPWLIIRSIIYLYDILYFLNSYDY